MKNIILAFIFCSLYLLVYGQKLNLPDSLKTKIYIIGVVHSENKFRNTDSLLNVLKDIKPDLILSEHDTLSGYFKSDYSLQQPPKWYTVARKLNIGRTMPPEIDLLYKYQQFDKSIIIYPFDMTIINRNKYVSSIIKNENLWVSALNLAFNSNNIPDSILSYHKKYITFNNWFFEICQSGYYSMNRRIVTDSIRQMMKYEYEYFPKLFKVFQTLSNYKDWYFETTNFWLLRNEVMAKNVIRFNELTNAKKVVVFTGLLHKYILTDLLYSYNAEGKYELVEYFEK